MISSIINGIFNTLNNERNIESIKGTNQDNRKLVQYQNAENLAQWRRETAYNDPINQVQRLRAAGLNPAMLYGTPPQNVAANSPIMQASRDEAALSNPSSFNALSDLLTMAQIENIKADSDKKRSDIDVNNVNIDYTKGQIEVGKSVVLYNNALADFTRTQKLNVEQDTKLLAKRLEDLDSQIALRSQQVSSMQLSDQLAFLNNAVDLALKNKQIEQISREMEWSEEQSKAYVRLVNAQVHGINSKAALDDAMKDLTDEQKNEVKKRAANWQLQNDRLTWQNNVDESYYKTEKELQLALVTSDILKNSSETQRPAKESYEYDISKSASKNAKKVAKSRGIN